VATLNSSWQRAFGKSIFCPGVGGVGVTAQFPKAEEVAVEKDNFADELGTLPCIALGDNHPRGPAVVGDKRLAVPFVGDKHVVVHASIQRIVGGIAVVALEKDVCGLGFWLHQVNNGEECDALEFHIELAPGGDAVEIAEVPKL